MEIKTKTENGVLTISPMGNIDYVTAPELDTLITNEAQNCESMIIDMKDVPYISSAGLRTILNADELMQNKKGVKLINVGKDVAAVLEMTGFYDVLDIQ